jgi:oxygen-independent coproporphyrinogen-3 oxidase
MFEFLYLGLRKTEGVSSQRFNDLFGVALNQRYGRAVDELIDEGYLSVESDHLKLTSQGIKLADSVFERLLV